MGLAVGALSFLEEENPHFAATPLSPPEIGVWTSASALLAVAPSRENPHGGEILRFDYAVSHSGTPAHPPTGRPG